MQMTTTCMSGAVRVCESETAVVEPPPPAQEATPEKSPRPAGAEPKRSHPRMDELPPFKVLLHNDDHNDMGHVLETLVELFRFSEQRAWALMLEAHTKGLAMVMVTHRERAELAAEQLHSKGLIATIEAA